MSNDAQIFRTAISKVDFFHDDWITGTSELDAEQRGVYITLCAYYWSKQGRIPENDRWLAGVCNLSVRKWRKIKNELVQLGKIEFIDGFLYQEKAEIALENAMKVKHSKQVNGSKGGKQSAEIRAKALKRLNVTPSETTTEVAADTQALRARPSSSSLNPLNSPLDFSSDTEREIFIRLEELIEAQWPNAPPNFDSRLLLSNAKDFADEGATAETVTAALKPILNRIAQQRNTPPGDLKAWRGEVVEELRHWVRLKRWLQNGKAGPSPWTVDWGPEPKPELMAQFDIPAKYRIAGETGLPAQMPTMPDYLNRTETTDA